MSLCDSSFALRYQNFHLSTANNFKFKKNNILDDE